MKRTTTHLLASLILLPSATLASAATIYQVKDINPGSGNGLFYFDFMSDLDGRLVFSAYDGSATVSAGQPWISDGTSAGTQLISAIANPGAQGVAFSHATSAGNVFFVFDNDGSGFALWDTDGTAAGTHRLTQIGTGLCLDGPVARPSGVFFTGPATQTCDFNNGRLSISDGTGLGTTVVDPSAKVSYFTPLAAADETLFYFGYSPGLSLLRSDGTIANTVSMNLNGNLYSLLAVNERMYLAFDDGSSGKEVWSATTTDTTAALTKDIFLGATGSDPKNFFRVDDRLFFSANDGVTGSELWISDGTSAGTQRVLDINPGAPDSSPVLIGAIDDVLLFTADDGTHGRELWRSDGTAAGTYLVKDILLNAANGLPSHPLAIVANRHLFFAAYDAGSVLRLWVSDGTANGTHLVDSPGPALDASVNETNEFASSNGHLFLKADSGNGLELHALDLLQALGPMSCKNPEQPLQDRNGSINGSVQSVMQLPGGTGTSISDLNVRLDLGHTFVGDLIITLTHVDTGTTATLINGPGGGNCQGDLLDIVLDDHVTASADSSCTSARPAYPRDQRYLPTTALSAFRGEDIGGKWVLAIQDAASGDSGTLHEWCLNFNNTIFANGFD